MIRLPDAQVHALVTGDVVVAFVERGVLTEGDEIDLVGSGPVDVTTLQPRYRNRQATAVPEGCSAVVVSVDPAAVLDPELGESCHIFREPGEGDLVVLRVYGPDGAVLDDESFNELWVAAEGALRE